MKGRKTRVARWAVFGLLVAALSVVAAGCGGGDGDGSASWEIPGLGTTLDEIEANAQEEGEVNIVQWPGYATLVDDFTAATGCKVNTKDAGTGDDMISLIQSGEYDGVSASGHTSVRLMAAGDVAPVNAELLPNYADIADGLKGQSYNSKDGESYGAPHGRGPNLMVFRSDEVSPAPDSWSAIWDENTPYKGKISIYDDSIFIADAALYLKATQPDLGIENPYQLTQEQFDASVALLKSLRMVGRLREADSVLRKQGQRRRDDLAVAGAAAASRRPAGRGDQAKRGNDGLV